MRRTLRLVKWMRRWVKAKMELKKEELVDRAEGQRVVEEAKGVVGVGVRGDLAGVGLEEVSGQGAEEVLTVAQQKSIRRKIR
jgi:hypothetical protein